MRNGNIGMHSAPYPGMEMQSYTDHQGNQSPRASHRAMTTFSRDDTPPIPYPPQHPHTLHPNHTLPAPLHHVTTGHTAIYPSHLAYTNTPYTHQQQQQLPQHNNQHQHHHHYLQQSVVRHPSDSARLTQQYGANSPQWGPRDSNPVRVTGPSHMQNMTTYSIQTPSGVRPMGIMSNHPQPHAAYPAVAPGQSSPQAYRRHTPPAPNQHAQYYTYTPHLTAAATVPIATARQPQPPPPPAAYPPPHRDPYYHTRTLQPRPQTQQQNYNYAPDANVRRPQVQQHVASPEQQWVFQAQYKEAVLTQQQEVPQVGDRGRSMATSGRAALGEEGGGGSHQQTSVDEGNGGNRMVLKPAANMARFRFNTEAILKASNIVP